MTELAFLDLSAQVRSIRPELEAVLATVLDDAHFVGGEAVAAIEAAFARYCGARHGIGVGSGTDAITLALQALGVGPGDEVVTAANTCVPTVGGIEAAGATAVLADVDPDTGTLDPGRLQEALSERTRALLPVHLYGQCADMDPIMAFARPRGLSVLEDAAHAHGAEYRGRRAGTLGHAAAFSFYPTKNLGAMGDGGMVVTDDAGVAERVALLRNHGEIEHGRHAPAAINSRLDTVQAAVLHCKLGHLDHWNDRRRALAEHYREALVDCAVATPVEAADRRHVYHLFVIRCTDRDGLRTRLLADGIQTLVHYPVALHRRPAFARLAPADDRLKVSERWASEVISLPLYPELPDAAAERVVEAVRASACEPLHR